MSPLLFRLAARALATPAASLATVGRRACSQQLELATGLFGRLTISSPGRQVAVESLNPSLHDDIGRVLVPQPPRGSLLVARQLGERDWMLEETAGETSGDGDGQPLRVMVPIPMDLNVSSCSGCSVSTVENSSITMTSGHSNGSQQSGGPLPAANFSLDRVKSGSVRVTADSSAGGHLRLGARSLLESLHCHCGCDTGRFSVTATDGAFQGGELSIEAPGSGGSAELTAGAVYCRSCRLRGRGSVRLQCASGHGSFDLEAADVEVGSCTTSSSVQLDSLEGSLRLRAPQAEARVHLTRPRCVSLDIGEGSVALGLTVPPDDERSAQRQQQQQQQLLALDITASGIDLDGEAAAARFSGDIFPLGPHAVRLLARVPCERSLMPLPADSEEDQNPEAASCTIRLLSGRVRLSVRSDSGLFAQPLSMGQMSGAGAAPLFK